MSYLEPRTLWISLLLVLVFGLIASRGEAQPIAILDLAEVAPEDGVVRRVYGATGRGDQGVPVAAGGDVDGDGLADYAVAFFKASPRDLPLAGEVDLIFGDGTTAGFLDTAEPSAKLLRFYGSGPREAAGSEIWLDDVTGDGLADLLIGRQNFSLSGRIGIGALTIVTGSPALRQWAATLAPIDLASPPAELTLLTLIGARPLDRLGIWMRTGDVDGDGVADIVVGADQEDLVDLVSEENRGAAYVIRGGPHLARNATVDLGGVADDSPLVGHIARLTPPAGSAGHHFGATCQIADLDGNGRGEVLVAATLNRSGASLPAEGAPAGSARGSGGAPNGRLYIAWDDNFPASIWPADLRIDLGSPVGASTTMIGADIDRNFGEEILGGLDYDADGAADLFVGDLSGDATEGLRTFSGIGYVFYRAATLRDRVIDLAAPPSDLRMTTIVGPVQGAIAGDTAIHGDFDADGLADLAVAAPHARPVGRLSAGAVYVLYGRAGGWPARIDTLPAELPPAAEARIVEIQGASGTNASDLGDTLAYSAAAADIDGDGVPDLVLNEMVGNGLAASAVDVGNLIVVNGAALTATGCRETATRLCLADGRFQVEARWRDFADRSGPGRVVPFAAEDSGLFWFFAADNWEVLVKLLDGCTLNGHFWFFAAATTNVEYVLEVTDTATGRVREYRNALGTAAAAITDTVAFATCP